MQIAKFTVGEAGEREVLRRVLAQLSPAEASLVGPGDDCAVIAADGDLVVTTDSMIEGPDFLLRWHSGFELGWKLAAVNLSDVAAMGATPTGLTVALACPKDTQVELLEQIALGLSAACRELAPGCGVVGGDLSTAPVLTATVTAFGSMRGRAPVLRSGAMPDDIVAYVGDLGLAGIGLSRLYAEGHALEELKARSPAALEAQLAPRPPVALGVAAAEAGASAMMDVSDGLSLDAARLASASGVTLDFSSELLQAAFGDQRGQSVTVYEMLTGGEDHGLLATFPADVRLPAGFVVIGAVRDPRADEPVHLDGAPFEPRGWDPFVSAPGAPTR